MNTCSGISPVTSYSWFAALCLGFMTSAFFWCAVAEPQSTKTQEWHFEPCDIVGKAGRVFTGLASEVDVQWAPHSIFLFLAVSSSEKASLMVAGREPSTNGNHEAYTLVLIERASTDRNEALKKNRESHSSTNCLMRRTMVHLPVDVRETCRSVWLKILFEAKYLREDLIGLDGTRFLIGAERETSRGVLYAETYSPPYGSARDLVDVGWLLRQYCLSVSDEEKKSALLGELRQQLNKLHLRPDNQEVMNIRKSKN